MAGERNGSAPTGAVQDPTVPNPYERTNVIGQQTLNSSAGITNTTRVSTSASHGGARAGAGRPSKSQKNGERQIGAGSIEHAFGIRPSLGGKAREDTAVGADTIQPQGDGEPTNKGGDDIEAADAEPTADAEPSWATEAKLQMLVGQNEGEEGYAYNREKNMKLRTGIVKEAMSDIDQGRALRRVRRGKLWDRPPEVLHSDPIDIQSSWKKFHQLSQFDWILKGGLMPQGWAPRCSCGCDMRCDGKSNKPRLVYGERENYILNAPERFFCTSCSKMAKEQKKVGVPKNERAQYSYYSTSDHIMEQLRTEHIGVYLSFPCMLTKRAAIDNDLLDSMLHDAPKGIGPAAQAETLERKHCERWQVKEVKWADWLKQRKVNPIVTNVSAFEPSTIEKCPHYLSNDIGGLVPSASWLVHVFCLKIQKLRAYFDAEVIKRLFTSEYFSLDASYKVPNWMMRWGGSKMYDVLESGLNEYGEVIMQHFASSDNHRQLAIVLRMLKNYGLNPSLAFSDVPDRDRKLLESIFDNLTADLEDCDAVVGDSSSKLPTLPITGPITCPNSIDDMIAAIDILDDDLDQEQDPENKVIMFDLEWPIFDYGKVQGKVSVVQLGANLSGNNRPRHVYPFARHANNSRFLRRLRQFLARKDVVFIGRMIANDISKLKRDYPSYSFSVANHVDVGTMAVHRGVVTTKRGETTLQNLTAKEGYHLPKPNEIRCGDVFDLATPELSQDVKEYCARDLEAPRICYDKYKNMPNLALRMKPQEVKVGQTVEVMSSRISNVKATARGTVVQTAGGTCNGINLSSTRFLIRVDEVFDEKANVHFPARSDGRRCKCGRKEHGSLKPECDIILLKDFGPAPFNLIDTAYRLRKVDESVCGDAESRVGNANSPAEDDDVLAPVDGAEDDGDSNTGDALSDDERDECDDESDDESIGSDYSADVEYEVPPELIAILDVLDESNNGDDDGDDGNDGDDGTPMDSADLEYYFDDAEDAAPGLSAGDNTESAAAAEAVAVVESLSEMLGKLIEDADAFAEANREYLEGVSVESESANGYEADDSHASKRRRVAPKLFTRVLGDLFHVMDRVKVPMHHDFKPAYYQALRAAFFIMDAGDMKRVKAVVDKKGRKWSHIMAFNFKYIALRVRRTVPPRHVLYSRVKAVFDFFQDQKDTKTGSPLFNEKARKKADCVLKAILRAEYSDPPGLLCSMYCRKTDAYGRHMVDKDGLWLYRSMRGTSLLESMHQKLTKAFGHTMAGVLYSDCLMTLVRHNMNWKASERNRPDFPQVRHYNGMLIDAVNDLYETIFGMPKYVNWEAASKFMVSDSPYGIVPLDEEGPDSRHIAPVKGLTKSLHYLALRQKSEVPYTGVKGPEEKKLVSRLVSNLLQENRSLSAASTFDILTQRWNQLALGTNKIYRKYQEHLMQYIKLWKKNKMRKEAIKESETKLVMDAVEYVPAASRVGQMKDTVPLTLHPRSITCPLQGAEEDEEEAILCTDSRPASPEQEQEPPQPAPNTVIPPAPPAVHVSHPRLPLPYLPIPPPYSILPYPPLLPPPPTYCPPTRALGKKHRKERSDKGKKRGPKSAP